jgi:hypothetical protein
MTASKTISPTHGPTYTPILTADFLSGFFLAAKAKQENRIPYF